jgi:hypothetical protein
MKPALLVIGLVIGLSVVGPPAKAGGCGTGSGVPCPGETSAGSQATPNIDEWPIMKAKAAELQEKVRLHVMTVAEANLQYQEYRFKVIRQYMDMMNTMLR